MGRQKPPPPVRGSGPSPFVTPAERRALYAAASGSGCLLAVVLLPVAAVWRWGRSR